MAHVSFCLSIPALVALRTGVVIPLALACLVLIVLIPSAAWRGKFSVPIYALLALAAGLLGFIAGHLAGAPSVHGTPLGIVVSIIFFLLVAAGLGCFLGILFFHQLPEPADASTAGQDNNPPAEGSGGPDH